MPSSRPIKVATLETPAVPSSRPKFQRREVMDDLDMVELELKMEMEKEALAKDTEKENIEEEDTDVEDKVAASEIGPADEAEPVVDEDLSEDLDNQSEDQIEDHVLEESNDDKIQPEEEQVDEREAVVDSAEELAEPIVEPTLEPELETETEPVESSTNDESEASSSTNTPPQVVEELIDSVSNTESTGFQTAPTSSAVPAEKSVVEEPAIPKTRPTISRKATETTSELSTEEENNETITKKPPPRVPKKPSSKIAAFQQMLEQQQQQDMGNLMKSKGPQIPMKRPTIKPPSSASESDEPKSGPPSRVNSKFTQNLNGLFGGVPMPGMALGNDPISALKAQRKSATDEVDATESEEKVSDVRRGRGRGPRGRKLPTNVKDKVEVNDDTLGNNSREINVNNVWSFSFQLEKNIESEVEENEEEDVATVDEKEESNETVVGELKEEDPAEEDSLKGIDANDVPPVEDELLGSDSSPEPEFSPDDETAPGFDSLTSVATDSGVSIISTTTDGEITEDGGDISVLSESEGSST